MNQMLQDLGYAFRTFRRAPGFAAVAIFTLALGIGATTAVFSVVQTVLLRPLPFEDQERLTVLWESAKKRNFGLIELSYANYRDWHRQNKVFEDLAALTSSNAGMNLTGVGEPVQLEASPVTGNFFRTLGSALGVAVFGTVMSARLDDTLDRLLPGTSLTTDDSLLSSPEAIRDLPAEQYAAVAEGIASGVAMVFLVAVPLVALAFALAWLLKEVPLRDDLGTQAPRVEGLEEAGAV